MDTKNTLVQHILVGLFSVGAVFALNFGLEIGWSTSFARVSFVLLFITMIIGPIMKLRKPKAVSSPLKSPWNWRGEFGIWFAITGFIHTGIVMNNRFDWSIIESLNGGIGGGGYGLANLLGLIAVILAFLLTITSFNKIIRFLGVNSWKWLHSFTYVLFYLVFAHALYFQFFTDYGSGPDQFGWLMVGMFVLVVMLQAAGFVKAVIKANN